MNKNYPKFCIIAVFILIFFSGIEIFAQELSPQLKQEVAKYEKLISEYKTTNNKNQTAQCYIKIGYIYWQNGINNDAIKNFEEALAINKSLGNRNGIVTLTQYIGANYAEQEKYDLALKYYEENLKYAREFRQQEQIANALINCSSTYSNLGKYAQAIPLLEEAVKVGLELKNIKMVRNCYAKLSEAYEKNGNKEKSFETYQLFATFDKQLKDKEMQDVKIKAEIDIATANSEKKAKELELSLQSFKLKITVDSLSKVEEINKQKEMEISLLNKEKEVQELVVKEKEAKLRSEKLLRYGMIIVIIVILLFSFAVLKQYREKQKANSLLEIKNIELQEKNYKIELQNNELQQKNDEIEYQRDQLEKKNNQITDSINYASKIQKAILPSENLIKSSFKESFIYYVPRDIVSGDFYWFSKHDEKLFIATVDCTGHGVPGAFMSMIGNTLLNEIVNEKKIFDPALALQQLNISVMGTLKRETHKIGDSQDDGMDITLACFDKKERLITLALANHYVYKFDNEGVEILDGDLYSIGGHWSDFKDIKYTNRYIKMKKGLSLYLFSDGYADQFGGDKGKKFMSERFKSLLENHQHASMDEQYTIVKNAYEDWKGPRRQVDDVLVIGIRIDD